MTNLIPLTEDPNVFQMSYLKLVRITVSGMFYPISLFDTYILKNNI